MRTAIFLGLVLVAYCVNPAEWTGVDKSIGTVVIIFFVMDVLELTSKLFGGKQ
jgi:hypothetical protein